MTDLGYRSATDLVAAIRAKEVASRELLDHLLDRVDEHNPAINAVITLDEERARETAAAADESVAQGDDLGPLHGLPMTIKDVFLTEGMRSASGCPDLVDNVPDRDARAVAQLKAAGAIVFGKTNLPIWAGDIQSFNQPFGVTSNPWDTSRTPGGSSGGAAAALAAGLTPLELGSDIGGSIRQPSHLCGTVGLKPSYEVVSQDGYLSGPTGLRTLDVNVVGPMARSVDDLGLAFDVLAGPGQPALASGSARLAAWLEDPALPVDPSVGDVLASAVASLQAEGFDVDEGARPDVDLAESGELYVQLVYTAMTGGTGMDPEVWELSKSIADAEATDDEPVLFRAGRAAAMRHHTWLRLDERRRQLRDRWAEFFRDHDALLCPVAPTAAFTHKVDDDPMGILNRTETVAGAEVSHGQLTRWCGVIGVVYLPSVVVPVGRTGEGLPVGIQVVSGYGQDRTALEVAGRISDALGGFEPPPGYGG
jgi:amidase